MNHRIEPSHDARSNTPHSEEPNWERLGDFPCARLPSGRSVEATTLGATDLVTIRSSTGAIVLSVEVGANGPILRFDAAELAISTRGRMHLEAGDLALVSRGDLTTNVGGTHHTRVAGAERLEASRIEMQANDDDIALRSREDVRLDGERVRLNDDPHPEPMPWTSAAEEMQLQPHG